MTHCEFFDDINCDPLPFGMVRGVSEDNLFSILFDNKPQTLEPAAITQSEPTIIKQIQVPNFVDYRKPKTEKKNRPKSDRRDYKKNICGYITKKIVRQFMSSTYKQKVEGLCEKYSCEYEEVINYYDKKIERITGPTHLDMLLNATKQDAGMKKCFKEFFIWFLRHRYLRYLLSEGKMEKKEEYVDYKNKTLLYLGLMEEAIECNLSGYGEFQSRQSLSMNSTV